MWALHLTNHLDEELVLEGLGDEDEYIRAWNIQLATEDMDALRRPHFDTLSTAFIAAVKADPNAFSGEVYLMSCPMVYDDREDNSAAWLQNHAELLNPYWGDVMLHCGEAHGKLN